MMVWSVVDVHTPPTIILYYYLAITATVVSNKSCALEVFENEVMLMSNNDNYSTPGWDKQNTTAVIQ